MILHSKSISDNVKALFRRGKCYIEVFSGKEARDDLNRAMSLDPSLESGCQKLLKNLEKIEKEKDQQDKQKFKNMFA